MGDSTGDCPTVYACPDNGGHHKPGSGRDNETGPASSHPGGNGFTFGIGGRDGRHDDGGNARFGRPPDLLPWCEETGGWPPSCKPMKPLPDFAVFNNPNAADGVRHYEAVRDVLEQFGALPAARRNPQTAASLERDYFARHGMRLDGFDRSVSRLGDDVDAALSQIHASRSLRSGVHLTVDLVRRREPVRQFERDLAVLDRSAAVVLRGREQTAYFEFSASLAQGYKFWTPSDEGGSGGVELLQGIGGGGHPPGTGALRMRKWLKYLLCDAIGALAGGLSGGLPGAVAGGIDDTLTAVVGDLL